MPKAKFLEVLVKVPMDEVRDVAHNVVSDWADRDLDDHEWGMADSGVSDKMFQSAVDSVLEDPAFLKSYVKEFAEGAIINGDLCFIEVKKKPQAYTDYVAAVKEVAKKNKGKADNNIQAAIKLLKANGYCVSTAI